MKQFLLTGAKKLGITIYTEQADQLLKYLELLIQWNKIYNLCAASSISHMISYHLLDSLSVASIFNFGNKKILDVGTGAGLPGVPLAIIEPSCFVTLLDARLKKITFLRHVVNMLKLHNITIALSRIESYKKQEATSIENCNFNSKLIGSNLFDVIISRAAIADVKKFVQLTERFVANDGVLIAMKSDPFTFKIGTVIYNDYKILDLKVLDIPGVKAQRSLIIIGKKTC